MLPSIESFNFHHLRYFWVVVQEGGVIPASRRLRVSHPTVSAQIKELEGQLGLALFDRSRRSLELTAIGRRVYNHAERIFGLGRVLLDEIRMGSDRPILRIGVTDDLPKLLVRQLIGAVLVDGEGPRISVDEERHRTLLGRLAVRELDLVLSDAPTPAAYRIDAEDHPLGSSRVSFLATPRLRHVLGDDFPECLDGAPFLAPLVESNLGRLLQAWCTKVGIALDVIAEVADSALVKTLGADGLGVFVVPRVAEAAACATYGLEVVGRVDALVIEYFGTTASRTGVASLVAPILAEARYQLDAEG